MPVKSTKITVLLLLTALLSACASGPERSRGGEQPEVTGLGEEDTVLPGNLKAAANDVLFQAIGLVGTPYRYGGNSPESGFDCSGLINYVFLHSAGLKLPRTTAALIDIDAPRVEKDRLYPGDLVYFNTLGGRVSHIGIYVGERRFVHAPSSGGTVRMDNIDTPYWQKHYVDAKRVLLDD
ncbi:MAG: C40 family peptidase [Gammaproteobacteria bacterium]|jgi:cell wall-associated NlpC family hydrolase